MRFSTLMRSTAALAVAALATSAHADEQAVRATLAATFPQTPIESFASTPSGLFEATVEGRVYYITDDGRYILGGPLIDTKTRVNLTAARLERVNAIAWDKLPLDLAIKRVKGTGARRIAIFEDPDCPYCKVLERTLTEIDDVTIYVLLYPIASLHPQANDRSKAIWCAKDRGKAWDEALRSGVVPAGTPSCETPIAKLAEFAQRHRVNGTPTIFLSDGRRVVGSVPKAELEQQMLRAGQSR
ncbi:MAG: DsbC family protein [Pseudomonadota bacterium]|nr:DsbC family protein [Pseudomonadota bacterium]